MAKSQSKGTKFTIDGTAVGSLTSIAGIEITADSVDVSAMDNTSGYKEYLAGLKDGGEVPFEGFLDGEDEGQAKAYEALNDEKVHKCAIVFPEAIGKTWSFDGIISKFATSAQMNNAITFSAAAKVSGKPVLAATAQEAQEAQEAQVEEE